MRLEIFLSALILASSCVKDEGNVKSANSSNGGTTTSGSNTGSPSTGSDPLAAQAWHLENTGQASYSLSSGLSGEDIDVKDVHNMGVLGKGVRVAVSDTGSDIEHPDLSGNTLTGEHRNYVFSDSNDWYGSNPTADPDAPHGTAVAGLIAALGWNNIGSRGVAPSAKFAAFKFIISYPSSTTAASYLAREVDQYYGNFDVFNYSWGMDGRQFFGVEDTITDALALGVSTLRNGKGALYVQSAGNSFYETYDYASTTVEVSGNANSQSDTATPYKIIVGATNANGVKSSYSSPGSNIWVSAPGGEFGDDEPAMVTTDIQGCNAGMSYRKVINGTLFNWGSHADNTKCDYTNIMNGTSSAAPVTTGVIALMLEARPELTWRDVKHILASTSDQIDFDIATNTLTHPRGLDLATHVYDYKWIVNGAGKLFSNWYGFGRVNAKAAVNMAKTYNLSTLGTFEKTIHSNGTWYYNSGALTGEIIFDTSPAAREHQIWVGHNYVIENVQIEVSVDHAFPGDLAILLESPDGTESRLLTLNNRIYSGNGLDQHILASNAFYGEESEGWWTIKIIDGDPTYAAGGELKNWKININGHRKSTDLLTPYPPTFITLGAVPATSDRTPVFAFTQSVSHASLLTYQAMVEKASDGTVVKNWTTIGLANSSQQFTGLVLTPGEIYNLKIRSVSPNGMSSVQLKQWTSN